MSLKCHLTTKTFRIKTIQVLELNCLILAISILLNLNSYAQTNYVPNPGFENITDCDLEYGEAYKATPWKIVDGFQNPSPDLFHACSTNPFFDLPILTGCSGTGADVFYPNSGDGMVGMVNLTAHERIFAPLIDTLPLEVDIYVAYSIITSQRCEPTNNFHCYSNSQALVFGDNQLQIRTRVLQLDEILYETKLWTKLETCYQADGKEETILIGDYKLGSQTLTDCANIGPNNFAYFYVDDVIVAPFDVVPDTLYICGDESLNFDIQFYDVPIFWSDGTMGGINEITEGGKYQVFGALKNCSLEDEVEVIKISLDPEPTNVQMCENEPVRLETFLPALWENGDTSTSLLVTDPGRYTAILLSDCGEIIQDFEVENVECVIQYFVPNVFSPNNDGANDQLDFFFQSEIDYTGTLEIFDRWGNLIFHLSNIVPDQPLNWDGTFNGQPLNPAVYFWTFQYKTMDNSTEKYIAGNVTLLQ